MRGFTLESAPGEKLDIKQDKTIEIEPCTGNQLEDSEKVKQTEQF